MKKYINFSDYPFFMPNYNPKEMLQMGVFDGEYALGFDDDFLQLCGLRRGDFHFKRPQWLNNEYKVLPSNYLSTSFTLPLATDRQKRVEWFNWYAYFYKGMRADTIDYQMITKWVNTVYHLYDDIIKVDDITKEPTPSDKQLLLEMGVNWKYYPNNNVSKEWMLKQFPLIP
jgi:hypothetical protein